MRWLPWVLLALAAAALVAALLPWMSCDLCEGGVKTLIPDTVLCSFCQDRPISPVRRFAARRPHPRLAALLGPPAASAVAGRVLLEENGVDPGVLGGRGRGGSFLFLDTEAGWRCVLVAGPSALNSGTALRLYLFDEEARLVDQMEVLSREPERFPVMIPEGKAILRVAPVIYDQDPRPGVLEVIVEGKATKHETGVRIDALRGRFAILP